MTKFNYIIIGGGIAGTTAAETIRSLDQNSTIAIFTEENERLYSRVLLPHFLRGENSAETVFLRKPESYTEKNLILNLSKRITKVDLKAQKIISQNQEEFEYDKLLLSTGGKVNKLPLPGADLDGVVYLRTFQDAQKIKEKIEKSKTGVVLGGGFIGIEFAQSFVKNNLTTKALIREKYFWENIVGENSGKLLSKILQENGVEVFAEVEVNEFIGTDSLKGVKLANSQDIQTDIAGVGIGIRLDLEYLQDSELTIKKGIVTNEFLETSVKNVWAAGDVAEFYDPVLGTYHNLGNWANASAQGRAVGHNMGGQRQAFETTSMYSINVFTNNLSFLGDPVVSESIEVVERGGLEEKRLARLLIKNDILVGASLINLPIERNTVSKLIKEKTKITAPKEKIQDLTFDLSSLIS